MGGESADVEGKQKAGRSCSNAFEKLNAKIEDIATMPDEPGQGAGVVCSNSAAGPSSLEHPGDASLSQRTPWGRTCSERNKYSANP